MPNRCRLSVLFLAGLALLLAPGVARPQDYPSRPIRLIITTPAGSPSTSPAALCAGPGRTVRPADRDRQPVGRDDADGADALNRATPDGYTLMTATSELTMLPFLKKNYRYDPVKDFTPIALLVTSWTVFAIHPKLPANTLAELIAYSNANPGKVRYGSGGVGGSLHIAVEMLRYKTGADLVHVPYRGGGQAASDAVAGQIEMVSLPRARGSPRAALRVLAQTGPRRHPLFADVPTTAEVGLPDVRMDTWFGLIGPPGMPEPVVTRLVRESDAVVNQPAFREKLFKIGCDVAWMPPTEFGAFMHGDTKKWEKLIPAMGIPPIE
jgi:tripartite-type tricarboxylate transporter receptor subunit TctC